MITYFFTQRKLLLKKNKKTMHYAIALCNKICYYKFVAQCNARGGGRKMINTLKLKSKMVELGYTQKDIAKLLDIAPATVSQKLNNVRPMTLLEANTLSECLGIGDREFKEYFFVKEIAQCNKNKFQVDDKNIQIM